MALTVTSILAFLVGPNLRDYVRNSRLTGASNDLIHSLSVARAEAVKRQQNVVVCASNAPLQAAPACSGGSFHGWFVFVDLNKNSQFDGQDVLLEQHDLVDASVTVVQDGSSLQTYAPTGFALPPLAGVVPTRNVVLCDQRGNVADMVGTSTARTVMVTATGRPRVSRTIGDVTTALGAIGAGCP